ncbi:MAG: hypothetical protein COW02_17990 [Comamonadaceae bacterium CG12_big_fil_rev_8_21_14_0_65_59_15]|nr:MAG: hypothetical protein COW02_17990 [Comamonadaceae bacterium CG12_big_fil_rev_8_21_14_0_65_59_15]
MMCRIFRLIAITVTMAGLLALPSVYAGTNIASTVHNLTPTGPGNFKAPEATGLCVFCHTPHSASPQGPLWNRALSGATYELYTSSTLMAQVKQPTGSSRLCLSCHDGTLAMGTLVMPIGGRYQPTLGMLTGKAKLGTNLSADHPISFVYDAALAANRGELVYPSTLTGAIKLDQNHEVQCTSCHDAHEDRHAKFMRMETRYGALCVTCHQPNGWPNAAHATSTATWNGQGTSPWPGSAYPSVSENACSSCHKPHAAAHGKALLAQSSEVANCMVCHSGTVAARNLQNEFSKLSSHHINSAEWTHTPKEDATQMAKHVTCTDCHNPHASNNTTTATPDVNGRLLGVRGISQSGLLTNPSTKEYEVCYKCHGLNAAGTAGFQRQDNVRNARLQFDPTNPSYHPVAAVGKNAGIQNLITGYTATTVIGCSSCHNNDSAASGGTSPKGPHGSNYAPILERQYDTADNTIESPQNYALCYKCHDRNALTVDVPGKFPHARHLNKNTSCASCHDAHGSRYNPRLINFMLFDKNGLPVVSKSTAQQRLEYIPSATGGQCYLSCHGVNHEPSTYP